jgi:hypothetical protein
LTEYIIHQRDPHPRQREFIESPAKRKVIRAGRRGGKTTGVGIYAVERFLMGRRILYAAPTSDQLARFWFEVCEALRDPISAGVLHKNETEHAISVPHSEQRIRAKTAWNADTLRGDYADDLLLDEWQLMNEDAWGIVGAPMLLDNDGDAVFVYTPPSLRTIGTSKARDKRHAAKMYAMAAADTTGRWAAFHFTSHDNPYISTDALADITQDMTSFAYRQEIMAEDVEDNPGALWRREWIDNNRVVKPPDDVVRVAVAMDPAATSGASADDCGIIGAASVGKRNERTFYPLEDATMHGTPSAQAMAAVTLYHKLNADVLVVEKNNGGEWLETVIKQVDPKVRVKLISATRGKHTRAEPISYLYEQGRAHHVGTFPALEDELCQWEPGDKSPNRLDALVWACTELMSGGGWLIGGTN